MLFKKSLFNNLAFFIFIALLTIFIAAGTSVRGAEEKAPDSAKKETAAPAAGKQEEAQGSKQKSQPTDINLAARVNSVVITKAEFDRSFDGYLQQRRINVAAIRNPDKYKAIQREVIDALISRELLWQEAKKKNYVAKDEDVDRAMSSVKGKFPSEAEFKARLTQSGYTEKDYEYFLRRQLSVRELVQKDISPGISVSDDEIHEYYAANPDHFTRPEQIRARHILVKVNQGADEAARKEAKKKIDGILAEAKGGGDFAELAKKHSEGPTGPKGGDLGFFARGQMVKPFEEASFALKPGEISDVVQTTFGYHIIKAEERRDKDTISEDEVKEKLREFLKNGKVQKAVQERVKALRTEGKVEVLIPQ